MRPVLFQIGQFKFYSFGLMAALALIVPGLTIVRPLIQRRGIEGEFSYELIIAAGVGAEFFRAILQRGEVFTNAARSQPEIIHPNDLSPARRKPSA